MVLQRHTTPPSPTNDNLGIFLYWRHRKDDPLSTKEVYESSQMQRSIVSSQHLTLGIVKGMWNASHFLDFYLGDAKGNGVQSYLKVFPNANYQSAKASASRLLKKPSVIKAMKSKLEKMEGVEKC